MEVVQYPYPIATRISISKNRRICLPKFLRVPVPYVLVESERAEHPWLGICGLDSLALQREECEFLRVVAEYRTGRPTIPKVVCDRHDLSADVAIWLMATSNWVEIWSDSLWQTEINRALFSGNTAL